MNKTETVRERGWQKQRLAAYLHLVDSVRAQECQRGAVKDNSSLLKPIGGMAYKPLGPSSKVQVEAVRSIWRNMKAEIELLISVQALLEAV